MPLFVEVLVHCTDLGQPAVLSDAMPHFPAVQIETGLPSDAVPEFIKQISSAIRKSETLQQSEIVESVQELAYGDFRVASWCA